MKDRVASVDHRIHLHEGAVFAFDGGVLKVSRQADFPNHPRRQTLGEVFLSRSRRPERGRTGKRGRRGVPVRFYPRRRRGASRSARGRHRAGPDAAVAGSPPGSLVPAAGSSAIPRATGLSRKPWTGSSPVTRTSSSSSAGTEGGNEKFVLSNAESSRPPPFSGTGCTRAIRR